MGFSFKIMGQAGKGVDVIPKLQARIKELENQLMKGVEGPDADAIRDEMRELKLQITMISNQGKT
jgi:protein-arginine kinase activator protein McsA